MEEIKQFDVKTISHGWMIIEYLIHSYSLASVRLWKFKDGGSLKARFLQGTIHLRRRHVLGGEGSKICQICRRIVLKNCRR